MPECPECGFVAVDSPNVGQCYGYFCEHCGIFFQVLSDGQKKVVPDKYSEYEKSLVVGAY